MSDEKALATVTPMADGNPPNNLMTIDKSMMYCSFDTSTAAGKVKLFNAQSNPEKRVADFINMAIEIKEIFAEMVEIPDEETGEVEAVPRCILIDAKGVSYVAVSKGIFGDLKRLIGIFGNPSEWEKPLKVTVKQVAVKAGSMLKLQLAG